LIGLSLLRSLLVSFNDPGVTHYVLHPWLPSSSAYSAESRQISSSACSAGTRYFQLHLPHASLLHASSYFRVHLHLHASPPHSRLHTSALFRIHLNHRHADA